MFLNLVTGSYTVGTPCQSRLTKIMKMTTVLQYLFYTTRKYNSDRDVLDQSSTSLVNNHFSRSPRG